MRGYCAAGEVRRLSPLGGVRLTRPVSTRRTTLQTQQDRLARFTMVKGDPRRLARRGGVSKGSVRTHGRRKAELPWGNRERKTPLGEDFLSAGEASGGYATGNRRPMGPGARQKPIRDSVRRDSERPPAVGR